MWQHVTRVGNTARYVCNHCAAELGKNPTHLKENMLTEACNAPVELRKIIHAKLVEGQNKAAATESLHERREKRSSDQLYGASQAETGTAGGALASGAASNAQRTASTGGGSSARSGGLRGFVSTMSAGENERASVLCARWIYREGLPFRTVESRAFKSMMKSVNPAFVPPSRLRVANTLLRSEQRSRRWWSTARWSVAATPGT